MYKLVLDKKEVEVPTADEIRAGAEVYRDLEPRDSMYKVTTYLLAKFWGEFDRSSHITMGEALGVLLLSWNGAFYTKSGAPDFSVFDECLGRSISALVQYKERDILSLQDEDEEPIRKLFIEFLDALASRSKGYRTPVGVAKALHLLAPEFFPMWDNEIAKHYVGELPTDSEQRAQEYFLFCTIARAVAEREAAVLEDLERPFLKLFDEFNYAKFTKKQDI